MKISTSTTYTPVGRVLIGCDGRKAREENQYWIEIDIPPGMEVLDETYENGSRRILVRRKGAREE